MKFLIFITAYFFTSFVFAAEGESTGSFFSQIGFYLNQIYDFFVNDVPLAIARFIIWWELETFKTALEWKFKLIEISYQSATTLIDSIGINDVLKNATDSLPSDVRNVLIDYGVFEGLIMVFEAYITSLVYKIVG